MTNEFLPSIKKFKEDWKIKKEKELTDDDIIAILDEHLQREVTPDEQPSPEDKKDIDKKKDDQRSKDDQVSENDEIEKISESQIKEKMEELNKIVDEVKTKSTEIDKYLAKIKRKEPPSGDTSDEAKTFNQKLKTNWFEVDV